MCANEIPLSDRQQSKLRAFFYRNRRPVSFILIEDGQSPRALLAAILGLRVGAVLANYQMAVRRLLEPGGILRLSGGLPKPL